MAVQISIFILCKTVLVLLQVLNTMDLNDESDCLSSISSLFFQSPDTSEVVSSNTPVTSPAAPNNTPNQTVNQENQQASNTSVFDLESTLSDDNTRRQLNPNQTSIFHTLQSPHYNSRSHPQQNGVDYQLNSMSCQQNGYLNQNGPTFQQQGFNRSILNWFSPNDVPHPPTGNALTTNNGINHHNHTNGSYGGHNHLAPFAMTPQASSSGNNHDARAHHDRHGDGRAKRIRTTFSSAQLLELERLFQKKKYLERPERLRFAERINLDEKIIKVWFQNRRMKEKREQMSEATSTSNYTRANSQGYTSNGFPGYQSVQPSPCPGPSRTSMIPPSFQQNQNNVVLASGSVSFNRPNNGPNQFNVPAQSRDASPHLVNLCDTGIKTETDSEEDLPHRH